MTDAEREGDLLRRFPGFFYRLSSIGVPVGWYAIIAKLAARVEPLGAYARDLKSKPGGLSVFLGGESTPEVDAAVEEAEARSLVTCESCGAVGRLRQKEGSEWLKTTCDAHADGYGEVTPWR